MTKSDIKKYVAYSILSWDLKDKKYEDVDEWSGVWQDSQLAYKDEVISKFNIYRKRASKIEYIDAPKNVHYNIFYVENEAIFAFRGTTGTEQWIMNFDFNKDKFFNSPNITNPTLIKPFNTFTISTEDYQVLNYINGAKNEIQIHKGFAEIFRAAQDKLFDTVDTVLKNKSVKKISFSGQSLGGALAKIAYSIAVIKYYKKANLFSSYAVGSPRVGNKAFETYLESLGNSYNIHFNNDLVAMVPPSNIGFSDALIHNIIKIPSLNLDLKVPNPGFTNHYPFRYAYDFLCNK